MLVPNLDQMFLENGVVKTKFILLQLLQNIRGKMELLKDIGAQLQNLQKHYFYMHDSTENSFTMLLSMHNTYMI